MKMGNLLLSEWSNVIGPVRAWISGRHKLYHRNYDSRQLKGRSLPFLIARLLTVAKDCGRLVAKRAGALLFDELQLRLTAKDYR